MDANPVEIYEEDTGDQPVDYSIKYSERNAQTKSHLVASSQTDRPVKKEFVDHEAKVDLFGDYAETDLDQPTDYSLRYAEDDTDDDEKQSPEYFSSSMQEDTIKTYCTEDTPYETPLNFSTATSMSDLRVVDGKEGEFLKKTSKKVIEIGQKATASFKEKAALKYEGRRKILESQKSSAIPDPGQVTPEKIVDYYRGETSDGFSRANSLSSLSSGVTQQNNTTDINPQVNLNDTRQKTNIGSTVPNSVGMNGVELSLVMVSGIPIEGKSNPRVVDKEGKVVTFGGQDYYAEETPLMFSRCSSLGSLSGFEQHSIHDDRSSIVSDFSRRTSGIVSPSELPDSPTQTVPPSPHNHKAQASDFGNKIQEEGVRQSSQHLSCSKSHISRNSVFEDDIATFKEESTPIEFSTATSLSSLTIDDEPKTFDNSKSEIKLQHALSTVEKDIEIREYAKVSLVEVEKDPDQVSDGDDDDEDMLAACISRGIANNRYRQSFKTSNIQKPVQSESSNISTKFAKTAPVSRLESSVSTIATEPTLIVSKPNKVSMEIGVVPDTVYVYCTEDTPADISPVGSQSNLSALSMPSVQEDMERIKVKKPEPECHRNDLSDESSNLSGEDEKILDECIQSGIPKVRQVTPPLQSCIHFVKKPEILPHKFSICGTPSSSPVETAHANNNRIRQKPVSHATIAHESELSDESPNQSDDEAILTECIESAMPKVRSTLPSLIRPVLPVIEQAESRSSFSSMSLCQATYSMQVKATSKKPQPFEDSLSLSEEEDIILAQCIRSGMPKTLNMRSIAPLPRTKKPDDSLSNPELPGGSSNRSSKLDASRNTMHSQLSHRAVQTDAMRRFCGTYFQAFSSKDTFGVQSAAKYTLGMSEKGNVSLRRTKDVTDSEQVKSSDNLSLSTQAEVLRCRSPVFSATENEEDEASRGVAKSNVVPSRHSSVSSLSEEESSLGSIEEWALLELCISSGIPKNKYRRNGMKGNDNSMMKSKEECETVTEDNYSIRSYNSYVCKT